MRTNIVYRCSWKKLALLLILLFVPLLTQFNCGLDVFLDPVITFWGVTHHLSHLCGGYDKPLFSLFQPLYLYFLSFLFVQRPQRERSPVEHRGNLSICPSICTYVRPKFRPFRPILRALSPLGLILTHILPNSPNPSNMAHI